MEQSTVNFLSNLLSIPILIIAIAFLVQASGEWLTGLSNLVDSIKGNEEKDD